ncbi:MAG: tetratricopeptide repeat protein [Desulfovibrio sp.]|jgi:tetratricopeptide (TPR) repeat protein|nr:tetratricopeptide repeat protein [Desulfovibrio sp.]
MNPQKNQAAEAASLLHEIQTEISAESAPLLRFILRYANIIAGGVVGLLLLMAGTGIWQWRGSVKKAEVVDELARITMTAQGEARVKALSALALAAPEKTRFAVQMALGQSAAESGNHAAAAAAYADIAKLDSEGALGTAAMIAQAGALLKDGKSADALPLLREAEKRLPEQARTPQLRRMLAEAAASAGQKELAAGIYKSLADTAPGREGDYFRARAAAPE